MSATYTSASLFVNGVEIASGVTATVCGATVTVTETPRPTLTAWTHVTLPRVSARPRRLCQTCGWTTRDADLRADNQAHAIGHLRAELLTHRLREGWLPVWGFAVRHMERRPVALEADPFGGNTLERLGKKTAIGSLVAARELTRPLWRFDTGLPESLVWLHREVAADFVLSLDDGAWTVTRNRLGHFTALADLVAATVPVWVAAAAVQELLAPRLPVTTSTGQFVREGPPEAGYVPQWLRGQYGIEPLPEAREVIVPAIERLRRRVS